MPQGMTLLAGSGAAAEALGPVPDDLDVLLVELDVADPAETEPWLVEAPSRLLDEVRRRVAAGAGSMPARLAVAVVAHESSDPFASAIGRAAIEALRGAVHSIVPELGDRAQVNVVVAPPDQLAALRDTLAFLAAPGASFLDSATLDLRGAA